MARRRIQTKRKIEPDSKYGDEKVAQLINYVMQRGKKGLAERIVYGSLDITEKYYKKHPRAIVKTEKNLQDDHKFGKAPKNEEYTTPTEEITGLSIFHASLANISPVMEVKSRRVGGATYQIPMEVPARRRTALAMRWLVSAANSRNESSMLYRLGNEIIDAYADKGGAVKKRNDVHRMAETNRAFSHYRF